MQEAGRGTAKQLKSRLLTVAASPTQIKGWEFDATSEDALDWIREHAAETITDISETMRSRIKQLIEDAFVQQFDVEDLTNDIEDLLGDANQADVIARTETMRASNEGQSQAWDQAVDADLLTGAEQQVWIVTPDDRLCPICGADGVDGQTVPLDGQFVIDGEYVDGPPLHPRCRCTVGLTL